MPGSAGPLLCGARELLAAHARSHRLAHYPALEMVHPLPEGEGRGEGEGGASPRINRWYRQDAPQHHHPGWSLSASLGTRLILGFVLLISISSLAAEAFSASSAGPSARVVIVHDPAATDAFRPRPEKIRAMVSRAITNFTGKATVPAAWRSLVSTQDVIGIKVVSAPGANSGTRPAVVAAVVEGLLTAGLPPRQIVVWDKQLSDLQEAGFS